MALLGIPISDEQCIGDSLATINNAFSSLDLRTVDLSSSTLNVVNSPTVTLAYTSPTRTLQANINQSLRVVSLTATDRIECYGGGTVTSNVAFGRDTLFNNLTGEGNTAIGIYALSANTTGNYNTACGAATLDSNTIGSSNTAYGVQALNNNTTGSNNVAVGYQSGFDGLINITTQSNQVVIGNNNTTDATIKVAWTVPSDKRDKTNFTEVPHGLEFVNNLKPIAYQFKKVRESEEPQEGSKVRYGFFAQDILALEGNSPVIINNEDEEHLKYNETFLIPVLVNAIKELSKQNNELKARVEALEN